MQADPFDKAQDRPFDSPFDKLKASLPETSSGQVNSDVRQIGILRWFEVENLRSN